ncbi:hypothetical protein BC938DRAFT_481280 [Jimgerdemannia flammicorona]|uniref:Uncharacterized protein n=1 Tax=Jimgerdemannia flammicorona TaxID=994334 RepID=A0A433QH68_9FUNG|nr:hypothetical protein BC938DRAFT_481280 [Jimgerdemannia flammicorona]
MYIYLECPRASTSKQYGTIAETYPTNSFSNDPKPAPLRYPYSLSWHGPKYPARYSVRFPELLYAGKSAAISPTGELAPIGLELPENAIDVLVALRDGGEQTSHLQHARRGLGGILIRIEVDEELGEDLWRVRT